MWNLPEDAFTVIEMQSELYVANEHMKALLKQNELLRQELNGRNLNKGQSAPATRPSPPPNPALDLDFLQKRVMLYELLVEQYPREEIFSWLDLYQARLAKAYLVRKKLDAAEEVFRKRFEMTGQQVESIRKSGATSFGTGLS